MQDWERRMGEEWGRPFVHEITIANLLAGGGSGLRLLLELQRMKLQCPLQISIVTSNWLGSLYVDLKGLEQGPVLNVVSVLREVVDPGKPSRKHDA